MLTALALRTPLSISVLHDRNPLFVEMRDGAVSNGYDLKVLNMAPEPRTVTIGIADLAGARLTVPDHPNATDTSLEVNLEPDKVMTLRAFVEVAAASLPSSQTPFTISVTAADRSIRSEAETTFEVPEEK
jgi:polyferredoxin